MSKSLCKSGAIPGEGLMSVDEIDTILVGLYTGHWLLVTGHWSLVTGHWSLVTFL